MATNARASRGSLGRTVKVMKKVNTPEYIDIFKRDSL